MNRLTFSLLLVASLLAVAALPGGAQLQQAQDCKDAAKWHLEQAMKWSLAPDQDYHLKASQAADSLMAKGYSCPDWRNDRMGPTVGSDGSVNRNP